MLWTKSLHMVLVASWFASLFDLPRIFNPAPMLADFLPERERLLLMTRQLLRSATVIAVPALFFGVWLVVRRPF